MAIPFGLAVVAAQGQARARFGLVIGVGVLLAELLFLAVTRARGAWIGGALGVAAFFIVRRPALSRRTRLLLLPGSPACWRWCWRRRCSPGAGTPRDANDSQALRTRGAAGARRAGPGVRGRRARGSDCGGGRWRSTARTRWRASAPATSRCCSRSTPSPARRRTASCPRRWFHAGRTTSCWNVSRRPARSAWRRSRRCSWRASRRAGRRARGPRGRGRRRRRIDRDVDAASAAAGDDRGLRRLWADRVSAGHARDGAAVRRVTGRARCARAAAGGRGAGRARGGRRAPPAGRTMAAAAVAVVAGRRRRPGCRSARWRRRTGAGGPRRRSRSAGAAAGRRRGARVSRPRRPRAAHRRPSASTIALRTAQVELRLDHGGAGVAGGESRARARAATRRTRGRRAPAPSCRCATRRAPPTTRSTRCACFSDYPSARTTLDDHPQARSDSPRAECEFERAQQPRLSMPEPRVAIVHDWLVSMRGGERVLESLCRLYPRAHVFTLRYDRRNLSPEITSHQVTASFVDGLARALPLGRAGFRMLLPLFPAAIASFRLDAYDLVISSSHAVAKGARPRNGRAVRLVRAFADALRVGGGGRLLGARSGRRAGTGGVRAAGGRAAALGQGGRPAARSRWPRTARTRGRASSATTAAIRSSSSRRSTRAASRASPIRRPRWRGRATAGRATCACRRWSRTSASSWRCARWRAGAAGWSSSATGPIAIGWHGSRRSTSSCAGASTTTSSNACTPRATP